MFNFPLVIVLYNPKSSLLKERLLALHRQFERIYLVDNSENPSPCSDFSTFDYVYYFAFGENRGIGAANNYGLKLAKKDGYDWCVTLDQDSLPPDDFCQKIAALIAFNLPDVGIIAPLYKSSENERDVRISSGYKYVNEVISSGCCINLKAFEAVGYQKEDFFIDCVDFEFCWNLRVHGYKIVQLQSVILEHSLGNNGREINLFGRHLAYVTNHPPLRKYYMARNSLYLAKMYKDVFPKEVKQRKSKICKLLVKSIFFENNKIKSLKAICLGVRDYLNNKKGICMYQNLTENIRGGVQKYSTFAIRIYSTSERRAA